MWWWSGSNLHFLTEGLSNKLTSGRLWPTEVRLIFVPTSSDISCFRRTAEPLPRCSNVFTSPRPLISPPMVDILILGANGEQILRSFAHAD